MGAGRPGLRSGPMSAPFRVTLEFSAELKGFPRDRSGDGFVRRNLSCNGTLKPVMKTGILHLLEPGTRRYYDRFYQCGSCGSVCRHGQHAEKLSALAMAARCSCCR